jgi:hypothetical protein
MNQKPATAKKLISVPLDALDWLSREAERNLSSANSEIVRCIRQRMDQMEKAQG